MATLTTVIFDFGGVFTSSPVEEFAKFEATQGLPPKFLGGVIKTNHHTNAWAQYERSEIGQDEFDEQFALESSLAGHEVRGNTLLSLLKLTLKPAMIDALAEVKKAGFKTGCITNNLPNMDSGAMLEAASETTRAANVLSQFDHLIESSKVGVRKPEPAIYMMMCKALGSRPEECVFLDDLGINLKPAQALGMTTIKVPFGNVQPAIDELFSVLRLSR